MKLHQNRIYSLLFCLFYAACSVAQNAPAKITILEPNQKPAFGATVRLINRIDSTKIYNAITDTTGMVQYSLKPGQYILNISSVGFKTIIKGINVNSGERQFKFVLEVNSKDLQGVTIVAKKPLLRQEDDKTIVDPEPLANSSTSAYEVLEKTPGLFLDQDGNVYISSTTPASIYINGREQKMSAADIAAILKSLPPNSIEKMEIMRTPSAKYEASSSGGIVNVVLKKGVKIGLTGSMNAGVNQGRFGNQFGGINLNNSNGGRTSFFNLNYTNRKSYDQIETNRKYSTDSLLSQKAYTVTPGQIINMGYGFGFELNKKWLLNLDGRGSYGSSATKSENDNSIKRLSSNELVNNNINSVLNDANSLSFSQGISTKYAIDTLGSELTSDFSYGYFSNKTDQDFNTQFVLPQKAGMGGNGDISTGRQTFAAQIDLKYKFSKSFTVEAGVKSSFLNFENSANYFRRVSDKQTVDVFRTNKFNYSENINSGYIQGSKTVKDFVIKLGARVENTNMNGHQLIPKDTTFSIKRTDLFPYLYLSRKIAKIAGYDLRGFLVYRRTITRPVYEYLNPFPKFIDQYLYEAGNPTLRPQFTQNYEANISVDGMPIFAIGQNYTQDIFTNVVYQDRANPSVAFRTYDNLGKNKETYFRLVGAIPPGKKYFFVMGTQYNHNAYNGLYENKPLTFNKGSFTVFTFHQLKLNQFTTLHLNGFVRLKGQLQFYELSNFGNLNLSINRSLLDRKLMLTLSLSDVFFTNNNRFTINQGNILANGFRKSDTRRVGFNLRYNFGFRKKEERNNPFDFNNLENSSK